MALTAVATGDTVQAADVNQFKNHMEGAATGTYLFKPATATSFQIQLVEAAGATYFRILDSAGVEVFSVDSNGVVVAAGSITGTGGLVLPLSATPTVTAEGAVQWDTDDNRLVIGDGATARTFYPGINAAPDFWNSQSFPTQSAPALGAGTANAAYLTPMDPLDRDTTITKIRLLLGGSTDNYDVGIYSTTDYITFTRVVSLGSTAFPGTGIIDADIADTALTRGTIYYLAQAAAGATLTRMQVSTFNNGLTKTTSFPLPATISSPSASGSMVLMQGVISGART